MYTVNKMWLENVIFSSFNFLSKTQSMILFFPAFC